MPPRANTAGSRLAAAPKNNARVTDPGESATIPGYAAVLFLDYLCVIVVYANIGFWMAVLIDGHLLPPFDPATAVKESTISLFSKICLQIALQGALAMIAHTIVQHIPSPFDGLCGYSVHSRSGENVRNPAIVTVVLFALSKSLQARIMFTFDRFDTRAVQTAKATAATKT
jgi:hypothetical protein